MLKKILIFLVFSVILLAQQNDDQNRFMLAQNYEQAGELEKSKVIYEDLFNRYPDNPLYFDALNRVYLGTKNYDGAISMIQKRISRNPMDVNLYGMLGAAYYLKGDEQKTYSTWDEGISKAPANYMTYRVMANYATERRLFDKAIEYLKAGKGYNDNPLIFSYDLANLYTITMQYSNAAREYLNVLEKDQGQLPLVQQRLLQFSGKPEAIKPIIEVFEKERNEDNVTSAKLLALLYNQSKEYDKAFELFKEIDQKANSQGLELFNYAQSLFTAGEYDVSSKIYDYLLKNYSSSAVYPAVKFGRARSLEYNLLKRNNENDWKTFTLVSGTDSKEAQKVLSAYEDIINSYPGAEQSAEAVYRMGKLKSDYLNDPKGAEAIFYSIEEKYPGNPFATLARKELAAIYMKSNDLNKSYELLSELVNSGRVQGDQANDVRYMLAKVNFYKGDFEGARNVLNSVIFDFKDNNSNDAISLSMLLNTSMNDSSNLVKFAEAEYLSEQSKFQQAKETYNTIAANQQAFMLAGLAKLRVAEMDIALDNYDASMKLLEAISQEKEKNIFSDKSLYLLGNIYQFSKKDKDKAIEIYERLLSEFPNSMYLDDARQQITTLRNKIS